MNRRDTLKSLLAGLFVGWWPKKKVEANPIKFDEAETYNGFNWWGHAVFPLDMPKIGQPYPTQWMTWVKAGPELIWSCVTKPYDDKILVPNSEGIFVYQDTKELALLIYVTPPGLPTKQLIEVKKLPNGMVVLGMGFMKEEIESRPDLLKEAIFCSVKALDQLRQLNMQIG